MASLFTAHYYVDYKISLDNGKTKTIRFTDDNYIYNNETCSLSDCHECYDTVDSSRYIIYARDLYNDAEKKTMTYIYLFSPDEDCEYEVWEMYINDVLIYADDMLIISKNE